MAYTIHDTNEVRARVDHDLTLAQCLVEAADPFLRSLVLTGGFARGEGSMLDGAPQNDYDLVALRGPGRPLVPYADLRGDLEASLGVHVDLAPVQAWRLRWVPRSIFWYETALRGRVLCGEDLLGRIRVRRPSDLKRDEALRLLVNRAAGLLLVTDDPDAHAHRLQAAKAFLAVLDAHLLAWGEFAPSQTERWRRYQVLHRHETKMASVERLGSWFEWAYHVKVDPATAPPRDAGLAWRSAARALLDTVPLALQHAGLASLHAYAKHDGLLDHVIYLRRARRVPAARRMLLHPTGRVRVATLRLLEAALDGHVRPEAARRHLGPIAHATDEPLRLLEGLRGATLQ